MRLFCLMICTALACLFCTGCVVTRFSESLLEYGVRHTQPDITTEVAEKDQYLWQTDAGTAYLYLPCVTYEQRPAPIYAFYVPEFVPFRFAKQHTVEKRSFCYIRLSDSAAKALKEQQGHVPLYDEMELVRGPLTLSVLQDTKMKRTPVTFNRRDLEEDDELPVWSERSIGGWFALGLLPVTFCTDIAASVVSTLLIDCFVLPGIGIVWLVEESLTTFPE